MYQPAIIFRFIMKRWVQSVHWSDAGTNMWNNIVALTSHRPQFRKFQLFDRFQFVFDSYTSISILIFRN